MVFFTGFTLILTIINFVLLLSILRTVDSNMDLLLEIERSIRRLTRIVRKK